jgi:Hint domain
MMDGMRRLLLTALVAMFAGCTGSNPGSPSSPGPTGIAASASTGSIGPSATIEPDTSPGASAEPTPAASDAPLAAPDLRYRLVDQVGRPLFCDPDFYPIARSDEALLADEHLAAIHADPPTYAAIAAHLGIDPAAAPTPAQVLAIYREWKMLRALQLTTADGGVSFDYVAADASNGQAGWHVVGTIDAAGTIAVDRRDPSGPPPCPICLARGTRIATPDGERPVEDLRPGMAVWTTDELGNRVVGRVLEVGSTPVPATHRVVHLVLSDGRTADVSPGHRLPDGRRLGGLRTGDPVDGATVAGAALEVYQGGATFDLLPSGGTGTYWANGILLASTLDESSEPDLP